MHIFGNYSVAAFCFHSLRLGRGLLLIAALALSACTLLALAQQAAPLPLWPPLLQKQPDSWRLLLPGTDAVIQLPVDALWLGLASANLSSWLLWYLLAPAQQLLAEFQQNRLFTVLSLRLMRQLCLYLVAGCLVLLLMLAYQCVQQQLNETEWYFTGLSLLFLLVSIFAYGIFGRALMLQQEQDLTV